MRRSPLATSTYIHSVIAEMPDLSLPIYEDAL
jgi:hypothetical protein